jgi:hypothetical protein
VHEGCVELGPVGGGQHAFRQRQDLGLLGADVIEVGSDVGVHLVLEAGPPRRRVRRLAHHLEREQVVLQVEHGAMAARVIAVEAIERGGRLRAARADLGKQQRGLLGVVHLLGKLVDVEQHRAQDPEVGREIAAAALRQEQADRTQTAESELCSSRMIRRVACMVISFERGVSQRAVVAA